MLYLIAKIGTKVGANIVLTGYRIYDANSCTFTDYEKEELESAIKQGNMRVENMIWRKSRFSYNGTALDLYPYANIDNRTKENWVLTKYFPNYTYYLAKRDGTLKVVSHDIFKTMVDKALVCNVPKALQG